MNNQSSFGVVYNTAPINFPSAMQADSFAQPHTRFIILVEMFISTYIFVISIELNKARHLNGLRYNETRNIRSSFMHASQWKIPLIHGYIKCCLGQIYLPPYKYCIDIFMQQIKCGKKKFSIIIV